MAAQAHQRIPYRNGLGTARAIHPQPLPTQQHLGEDLTLAARTQTLREARGLHRHAIGLVLEHLQREHREMHHP